jgi:hypothetical protein
LRVWPNTEKFVVFRPPPFDEADVFEMSPDSNGSSGNLVPNNRSSSTVQRRCSGGAMSRLMRFMGGLFLPV